MNPNQIDLVRDSFVQILVDPERAARLFYDRLFELAPDTRALFRNDLAEQGRQLIESLGWIVTGLSRLEAMLPAVRKLAQRHVGYGVEDRHYAIVGRALLHMVTVHGGASVDAAIQGAWTMAYALVSDAMIDASREVRALRDAA
jgi:nitric oxide dioxygenase